MFKAKFVLIKVFLIAFLSPTVKKLIIIIDGFSLTIITLLAVGKY